ncbi:Hpt domain-containing protein [Limnobacter sp.]|uniref:Hpt domain-containing protein n=1 Tax=Limnobacter sp. TaxID=2003368 RepID=UPI0035132757
MNLEMLQVEINVDEALERLGQNEDLLFEILEEMLDRSGEDLERLEQAKEKLDWTTLAQHSHFLKGILANLAVVHLLSTTESLEKAAREKNPSQVEQHFKALQLGFERLKGLMKGQGDQLH